MLALQQLGPRPLPLFLSLIQNKQFEAPQLAAKALSGLKRLQSVEAAPATIAAPVTAQNGRATLYDFGGYGPTVVFIPSLINPATILDILPERSLLGWLRAQGVHPYLVDWGHCNKDATHLSISDHVTELIIPLLRTLPTPPHLIGYCLGGTMALAAAQLTKVKSLTMIAAPWRFGGYSQEHRAAMGQIWQASQAGAQHLGALPIEVLQTMFWHLDPDGTVAKYAAFADLTASSLDFELFVAMEAWANTGAPLPIAAGRELFDDFIAGDLPGRSRWVVAGRQIVPQAIQWPVLEIVSTTDRIVPAATATQHFKRLDIDRGHVGMITGSQAKSKLWEPLREWLSQSGIS